MLVLMLLMMKLALDINMYKNQFDDFCVWSSHMIQENNNTCYLIELMVLFCHLIFQWMMGQWGDDSLRLAKQNNSDQIVNSTVHYLNYLVHNLLLSLLILLSYYHHDDCQCFLFLKLSSKRECLSGNFQSLKLFLFLIH